MSTSQQVVVSESSYVVQPGDLVSDLTSNLPPDLAQVLHRPSTKVIRYSILRTLGLTLGGAVAVLGSVTAGLSAGSGWVGWAFVGFGLLVAIGVVCQAVNVFNRRPVLVLCAEGLVDTREKGALRFTPWDHIRKVSTYRFELRSLLTSTTMVEVVKLEIDDGVHQPWARKIDVDNLNRRAGAIAALLVAYGNGRTNGCQLFPKR